MTESNHILQHTKPLEEHYSEAGFFYVRAKTMRLDPLWKQSKEPGRYRLP
ncbi:hypothetical protein [Salibacterium halotolerans]|nr:hypothetical protein [Salibacterium halotolerans]